MAKQNISLIDRLIVVNSFPEAIRNTYTAIGLASLALYTETSIVDSPVSNASLVVGLGAATASASIEIGRHIGGLANSATGAYVERARSRLSGVHEVNGELRSGVGFRIINSDGSALSYTIGQPGIPAVDATFCFRPDGSWNFERTEQETLYDEGQVTHSYDSTQNNSPRDILQVLRSCHFIFDHTIGSPS